MKTLKILKLWNKTPDHLTCSENSASVGSVTLTSKSSEVTMERSSWFLATSNADSRALRPPWPAGVPMRFCAVGVDLDREKNMSWHTIFKAYNSISYGNQRLQFHSSMQDCGKFHALAMEYVVVMSVFQIELGCRLIVIPDLYRNEILFRTLIIKVWKNSMISFWMSSCTSWWNCNHGYDADMSSLVKIDGLVQDCSNSSALAMELLQSCTKPSKSCSIILQTWHLTNEG